MEKQVAFLDENTQYGAVFTNAHAIGENGELYEDASHFYSNIFNQPNRSRHEWLRYFFYDGNALCHPSILIRKSCYDDCGLYRFGFAQIGDLDMWIRVCLKYEIYMLPQKLVRFRIRDNEANASGNRIDSRIRFFTEFYLLLENYFQLNSFDDFVKVFPEARRYFREDGFIPGFVLAMLFLEPNMSPAAQAFGIMSLFDLLWNEETSNKVKALYDFDYRDLIKITGEHDIFSAESLTSLRKTLVDREDQIANLNQTIFEYDGQIVELNQTITERDGQITERDGQIAERDGQIAERDGQIVDLNQTIAKQTEQTTVLAQAIAERDEVIKSLNGSIKEIHGSRSWRITAPIRFVTSILRMIHSVLFKLPYILNKKGGIRNSFHQVVRVVRREGFLGIKTRMRRELDEPAIVSGIGDASPSKFSVIPYYIDPTLDSLAVEPNTEVSIAIHLHLYSTEMIQEISSYLNNIPFLHDLYISMPESCDSKVTQAKFAGLLSKAKNVFVENVPSCGRDFVPLIIQFGNHLSQYEIIGHIHSKKAPHNSKLADWRRDNILNLLMGTPGSSGGRIAQIIELLQGSASIVLAEGRNQLSYNCSSGPDNDDLAKNLLKRCTQLSINDLPEIEFFGESMFWARAECLKDFLELPIKYSDFPTEPIPADDTLRHTIKRLLLFYANKNQGKCVRILEGDSIQDYCQYEEQRDYSSTIIYNDVKILSYYLPQFHPIPENDLWHGKGFTEWTKVKAATPLFEGHYQQHIPHTDIGYYLLDSPDMLQCQAEMMRKAGVYGQVFYHYWFSGKLILEEAAKILLDAPDIQMPFCFCWANENWTRRWDGNEDEILLEQHYSAEDAKKFIDYLIPFFRDPRYIKVENRPILFVYRPSSIPNPQIYTDIWAKACVANGIQRPYVVAVLTRGATDPKDFGMDAGVERVLHDWTAGAVPELKNSLHFYQSFNGSVLSYDEVVKFYAGQTNTKNFPYFRSLLPFWDNTARYGSEALLLHGSTPERFQKWMESTIEYTRLMHKPDMRFVLVNAWNEWAEGAHLEPDSRYGYSYLNSIGRALSGIPYSENPNPICSIPIGTKVHLSFSEVVLDQLKNDPNLKKRFIYCLSRSSIFNFCQISINALDLLEDLPSVTRSDSKDVDYVLQFCKVAFFDYSVIENMLQSAFTFGSQVIANSYGENLPLIEVTTNGSVKSVVKHIVPMLLLQKGKDKESIKNFKIRTDANCFVAAQSQRINVKKPVVTTVMRFHKSANLSELKNALYCLYAMKDCVVIPLIAAQDLNEQQTDDLEKVLNNYTWTKGFEPQVYCYQSPEGKGDLRSVMLNESIQKIKTRYAAFLDYDDLLMSHAYSWLINRIETTGKAATFGRVYATFKSVANGLLIERKRLYQYGYSYEDFFFHNHAPLHSFMLDIEKLDLSNIVYYEDQIYMEDYLLTLQLFTENNCDWASLLENFYIGDYIHSIDRKHTLAFSNEKERDLMYSDPQYNLCEKRISDIRKQLHNSLTRDHSRQMPK